MPQAGTSTPDAAIWQTAVAVVLLSEGGYSDDPADSGGRSNHGITQATLNHARRALRDVLALPADVAHLTRLEAEAIYRALYWTPIRGDDR